MKNLSIIDYGLGNLFSVARAFGHIGADVTLIDKAGQIKNAGHLLLPGVGAFAKGMEELQSRGLVEAIQQHAKSGKPLMSICLGMQMLFDSSEENSQKTVIPAPAGILASASTSSTGEDSRLRGNDSVVGLGLIKGKVVKIGGDLKIPHIGWTKLHKNGNPRLLGNVEGSFYFVHSYHGVCDNPADLAAYALYGEEKITAVIEKDNIFGCQFHPEKSAESGLNICRNFLKL